jgi:hypothetical protein
MLSLSLRRASAVLIAAALLIAAVAFVSLSHSGATSASPRWNGGLVTIKHAPAKHPVKHPMAVVNSPRWN